ncbi:glycosyl transferase group 1 [Bacteroidia bacterium]|nr:glycosyl transferase group 1 [Bacteroidia bacterium]
MKIFLVLDELAIGGMQRRCLQLVKGLVDKGYNDVHLIIFNNIIEYTDTHNLNIPIHILNRKSHKDISVFFKLLNLIRTQKPDIVVSWTIMSTFWLNFIRLFINFNYLCAYVSNTTPFAFFSFRNFVVKFSFLMAKYIIGNSQVGLNVYKVPFSKRKLIYNGFNFKRINNLRHSHTVHYELNITTKYTVTMVARVIAEKGYQTFIDAAKLLLLERNDVTFLCVGNGNMLNYFKKQLSETESTIIKFIGNSNQVEEIINISDICVLSSNYSEGVSNFIMESMAIGKPVISTNVGGTPEIVQEKITGYMIKKNNFTDLKHYINILLDNEDLRIKMGIAATQVIREKFSLDRMCNEFSEVFEECLTKQRYDKDDKDCIYHEYA